MTGTLADIVVVEGLLDAGGLDAAARRARRAGTPLVVALVEHARLDPEAILEALSRHLRLRPVDPLAEPPDLDALREVAHDLARRRCVFPLSLDGPARVLRLAMADPTDRDAVAEVEVASGCRVEAALAPLPAVERAIARAYRGLITAVIRPTEDDTAETEVPRVPFGGDLVIATPALSDADRARLGTEPHGHIEDEVPLELRHRALVELLVKRGVLTAEEYVAEIRGLLKGRE